VRPRIALPWPAKTLSPNARVHWRVRHGAARIAKDEAFVLTKAACIRAPAGTIPMTITFNPPDARHRDDDNAIASFKAARDGIALGLGVDDRVFRPTYVFGEPVKGGRVLVEIGE
jgi:crossover junction endodeoxyribonuclease RusA